MSKSKPQVPEQYREMTETILGYLRKGVAPWRCPWDQTAKKGEARFAPSGLPRNAVSGRYYSGGNTVILWLASMKHGFQSNLWATAKSWERIGGKVKPGQPASQVSFWFQIEVEVNDNGRRRMKKVPLQKWYEVYALEQVAGAKLPKKLIPAPAPVAGEPAKPSLDYAPVEELVGRVKARIVTGGTKAYYDRALDYVGMPERKRFTTQAGYYSTLLHELGHWTGHKDRLNRFGVTVTPEEYAFEELVAELGSCFLLARLGVPDRLCEHPEAHASYIGAWIARLENDERAIWDAASKASKWNQYLLSLNVTSPEKPKKKRKKAKRKGKSRKQLAAV